MKSKAISVIERYQMLKSGATIIVAFSGGADSIALLYFLNLIKEKYNIKLLAAHVNHGIRGQEADRDEEFVKEFCKKIDVDIKVLHCDVPKLARESGESEEQCGRRIRYEFFNSIDKDAIVATAHTLSDNVETILFNLSRGTALKGLCGIPPVRDNIIRPLIECTREDIENYCFKNELSFVTDSTNNETEYSRNKIRHKVIPKLKEINPNLEKSILRCCASINNDDDFLEGQTIKIINQSSLNVGYDKNILKEQHISIRYRVLDRLIYNHCGVYSEKKHLQLCDEILFNDGQVEICRNGYLRVKNGVLDFPDYNKSNSFWCLPFKLGKIETPIGIIETKVLDKKEYELIVKSEKDVFEIFIDYDKMDRNCYFRCRKEGDSFSIPKRKITKSLKKLYNEAKIPLEKRNSIVILADENDIYWIEDFGASDIVSVSETTKKVLQLKIWR